MLIVHTVNVQRAFIEEIPLLPVTLMGFAVVAAVSATLVETVCDVVDGSAVIVDKIVSAQTAFVEIKS